MNKLPQRIARVLAPSTPLTSSLRRYCISLLRAADLFRPLNAHIHVQTTPYSHVSRVPTPLLRPSRNPYAYTPPHTRSMSSDADYAAFLDKANQDSAPAEQQDTSKKSYGTKSVNTAVPKALESVEEYYVSDADEPFEPVALEFSGENVSASDLKKLLGQDKVEEVTEKDFGSQYKNVLGAVKKAGNGEVKVFRVDLEGTRAEYYVVSVDKEGGKLVGLKALSVES